MSIKVFLNEMANKRKEIDSLMRRKMPVKVGAMAKDFYQRNITDRHGFLNNGLQEWPLTRRQKSGGLSARSQYGQLLNSRHLLNSMTYTPGDSRVVVSNHAKYASTHNNGANIKVTDKMRGYWWRKYMNASGVQSKDGKADWKTLHNVKTGKNGTWGLSKANRKIGKEVSFYKAMAISLRDKEFLKIPQRQFLGKSKELNEQIRATMGSEIRNIINN